MLPESTSLDEALVGLTGRRSVSPKRLCQPGPDSVAIDAMLQAALRAPDHGGLHPWRVIEFRNDCREALADAFEQEKRRRDPLASALDLRRAREHATRPPVLLGFVVVPRARSKVPLREQWLGAGAALCNLLNAAHLLGFGAIVLSGERCHDEALLARLGIGRDEFLAGFVSLGTVREPPPEARLVLPGVVWSCWSPLPVDGPSPAPAVPTPDLGLAPGAERARIAGDDSFEVVRRAILADLRPVSDAEALPLAWARGRVLAHDLVAAIDVPAHDNAAMDGFALRGPDLRSDGATVLVSVDAALLAGRVCVRELRPGECLPIMTGAPMPPGLDTVVPIEQCEVDGASVRVPAGRVRRGDNVRPRGEDFRVGQAALPAGRRLRPVDLGIAAALGQSTLGVLRPLRVALLSCGHELATPGAPLAPGQVYDSNRFGLSAALQAMGADILDLGCLPDDPERLSSAILDAAERVDAVVSSGGVGEGDADFVGRFLRTHGEVICRRVAMRPGRPFSVARLKRPAGGGPVWHFALPGNPVAALVAFEVLVCDALQVLAGTQPRPRAALLARSDRSSAG